MANRNPADIGVGRTSNSCERTVRDRMLNSQFNPWSKDCKECFGPVWTPNRTEHDLEMNAKFGCGQGQCGGKEGFVGNGYDHLTDNPYNPYSYAITRN